ncbi:hypothetical protein AAG570_007122 [Ranatra chinensis]|uniref:Uncharacterized protein n=1 Tax=Ranatra chinensis TaxID=642074 RepID=A0ABD0XUZ0_9HEMI
MHLRFTLECIYYHPTKSLPVSIHSACGEMRIEVASSWKLAATGLAMPDDVISRKIKESCHGGFGGNLPRLTRDRYIGATPLLIPFADLTHFLAPPPRLYSCTHDPQTLRPFRRMIVVWACRVFSLRTDRAAKTKKICAERCREGGARALAPPPRRTDTKSTRLATGVD